MMNPNLNHMLNDLHRDEMLRQAQSRQRRTQLLRDAAASRHDQSQPILFLRGVRFQKRAARPRATDPARVPQAQLG